jgi:transaldolase
VLVRFGCEILKVVPGRVSTEVDARLSFDAAATWCGRERLIELYQAAGVPRPRADQDRRHLGRHPGRRALEARGIHCNLTLLFAFCQAVACGEAGCS